MLRIKIGGLFVNVQWVAWIALLFNSSGVEFGIPDMILP